MSINTFVYPYPINVFIISRLGMTVEQFCELHGYKQSTVASWVTRNRAVKTLPCDFLYCLSLSSGWSMDDVYRHLLVLEEFFLGLGGVGTAILDDYKWSLFSGICRRMKKSATVESYECWKKELKV